MTKHGLNYAAQDRGDQEHYQKYLSGMDSVIVEKIASASAYFSNKEGYFIVDVGMASGAGTYILAILFPNCKVIGIDINPKMVEIANSKYNLPNLEFITDDGEKLEKLSTEKIIGFFNCSSIHHITSFNNYNPHKAYLTIKRQVELLQEGGVIVIRDFVKPENREVNIAFPKNRKGIFDGELLQKFSKTARCLSPENERGFPLSKIDENSFILSYPDALEFIRRKDYLLDWDVELQEEYGYYSQKDFEEVFSDLGLRAIVSSPIFNPWIIANRYTHKFKLFNESGKALGTPPTNFIIAGEKTGSKGVRLNQIRQLPIKDDSFLKIQSYKNDVTNNVYDVAMRPNPVIDILPYYIASDGNTKVIAKHGYPRPIITQVEKEFIIDKKNYSGYVTESITAMKTNHTDADIIIDTLKNRADIAKKQILKVDRSQTFYTSPGGINEIVDSYLVEIDPNILKTKLELKKNYSGFNDSGEIRAYDALQLLNSIQVGALPDVRLELSIYSLFYKLGIDQGKWLSNLIPIKLYDELKTTPLKEVLNIQNKQTFSYTEQSAGFLAHYRAKFYEYRKEESAAIFEYIQPKSLSVNTVVTLPVYKNKNTIYVGIEPRYLPVPQIQEGNSLLLAAPAFRVKKSVSDYTKLMAFIKSKHIGNSKIVSASQLGEKYFPCTGMTPEQVYPYIVTLNKPTDSLFWISLEELFEKRDKLRDGHLLVSIFRLKHALSQFKIQP